MARWVAGSGSGGGGGGATAMATIYVASSTATAAEKALATPTYTCDGTADDVQIQAAVDAVTAAGGGRVVLSGGRFFFAATVNLIGPASHITLRHVAILGAGLGVTRIRPTAGVNAFAISAQAQVTLWDMEFECFGATTGIVSTATTGIGWAFWYSSFKNLRFTGTSDGTSTGWALNLDGPFRSVFENIDAAGMVNGIRLHASNTNGFNPGNCVFTRCFVLTYGSNGVAYLIDAATGVTNNIYSFSVCEGYADGGTGNTAVRLGGSGGTVAHTRFNLTNFEQYDTIYDVVKGWGNFIDGDFWDLRSGATANTTTLVRFRAEASANKVTAITGHYTEAAHRLVVNEATDSSNPNLIEHVNLVLGAGGAVTRTDSFGGTLVTRSITAGGPGASGASTVVKRMLPFAKVVHGATAGIIRPPADYVLWEGSVQPTNWIDGDDWNQT